MKTSSHRLTLNKEGLERFCLHVADQALLESKPDEKRTQYLMPDGRTTLQFRGVDNDTYLDITTTTLFQPAYVKKLIKAVNPHCTHPSFSSSPNNPNLAWLYNHARDTSYGETVNGGGAKQ